jgi:hypothetical protein
MNYGVIGVTMPPMKVQHISTDVALLHSPAEVILYNESTEYPINDAAIFAGPSTERTSRSDLLGGPEAGKCQL